MLLQDNAAACCTVCDAVLARTRHPETDHVLALALAAGICLVIANVMPVLAIEFGGMLVEANIWTAVLSMQRGWFAGAALVLAVTTLWVPALQIALLLWLLSFARAGRCAPGSRVILITLHRLRPWSMTEVFLLGALVAIVKLSNWVRVIPGEGIWALGGLTILLVLLSRYDPRAWWELAQRTPS
jgi:paraquat-inducible protein A